MTRVVMSSATRARIRAAAGLCTHLDTAPRAVQWRAELPPRHFIERLTIWDRTEWLNDLCRSWTQSWSLVHFQFDWNAV